MNSVLSKVVDNYASVIDIEKEGSVREIFEHYTAKCIENPSDFGLRMDIGTGYLFFSGFKESYNIFNDLKVNDILNNVSDDEKWDGKAPIRVVMGREIGKFTKEILLSIFRDNANKERRMQFKDMIEFFDYQIADNFVYSLYFSSKFTADSIPTDLAAKPAPTLSQ